ncbi:MAG: hypothetical protein M3Y58_22200, partial [Chloroflexota bacterium]|nr:hypothetical protein [Chloroflexota bacterium]
MQTGSMANLRCSRRAFVQRGAMTGLSAAALPVLLAACGNASPTPTVRALLPPTNPPTAARVATTATASAASVT